MRYSLLAPEKHTDHNSRVRGERPGRQFEYRAVLLLLVAACVLFLTPYSASAQDYTQLGLDIDGEAPVDFSGLAVSLSADGSTAAVGAPFNDGNGDQAGHVRVYRHDGAVWNQLGADIDGEAPGDQSGWAVSLSADGSTVAIGAIGNDGDGNSAGHVRVYEFDGTAWNQLGADIDGEAAQDASGHSVSLSADGNRVAISALLNDGNGNEAGHVRVYEYDGAGWNQLGADIDGEVWGDQSGHSVSLSASGTRVAIGARSNDDKAPAAGHVRVYEFDGTAWNQLGADIDGEAAGDESGWAVSLSADGSTVAIGAPRNDGNGTDAGHVRVYEFDGAVWNQMGADIDSEAARDWSGWSVSLSADGSTVAVGAYLNDGNGGNAGHVRVYEFDGTAWNQLGADIDGEAGGDQSGFSVSLSADGSAVAIGAPYNEGNGRLAGHVRVMARVTDFDSDGILDDTDNCHAVSNPGQEDYDGDNTGDACDPDDDNDGVSDIDEATAGTDPLDSDSDGDGVGDLLDVFPLDPSETVDTDTDGVGDNGDNCPADTNPDQSNNDGDAHGDLCDDDDDNDGLTDSQEGALGTDPLNPDTDADTVGDSVDNCALDANTDQADLDGDGTGDACDTTLEIAGAIPTVEATVNALGLPNGLNKALTGKLTGAADKFAKGNSTAAANQLQAFINQVNAKRGKNLTDAEADSLIAMVMQIISALSDGTAGKGFSSADQETPGEFALLSNYPNPFNPVTTIRFNVPESAQVTLSVYDASGRIVARLVNGVVSAGVHEATLNAADLPSGVYLSRLTTPVGSFTQSMILMK